MDHASGQEMRNGVPFATAPLTPGQEPVGGKYKFTLPEGPPVKPKSMPSSIGGIPIKKIQPGARMAGGQFGSGF